MSHKHGPPESGRAAVIVTDGVTLKVTGLVGPSTVTPAIELIPYWLPTCG